MHVICAVVRLMDVTVLDTINGSKYFDDLETQGELMLDGLEWWAEYIDQE